MYLKRKLYSEESKAKKAVEKTKEVAKEVTEKGSKFLKTRNGKIAAGVVGAAAVGGGILAARAIKKKKAKKAEDKK